MSFRHDLRARIKFAALVNTPRTVSNGMETLTFPQEVHEINDRAIEMTFNEINVIVVRGFVHRQVCAGEGIRALEFVISSTNDLQRAGIGKIEAVSSSTIAPITLRLRDAPARLRRMLLQKLCPFTRAFGTVLPEICTFPEPIVAILANGYVLVVPQNALSDSSIAAVVAEDKRRREHRPAYR